jgi:hypothetical protein
MDIAGVAVLRMGSLDKANPLHRIRWSNWLNSMSFMCIDCLIDSVLQSSIGNSRDDESSMVGPKCRRLWWRTVS